MSGLEVEPLIQAWIYLQAQIDKRLLSLHEMLRSSSTDYHLVILLTSDLCAARIVTWTSKDWVPLHIAIPPQHLLRGLYLAVAFAHDGLHYRIST